MIAMLAGISVAILLCCLFAAIAVVLVRRRMNASRARSVDKWQKIGTEMQEITDVDSSNMLFDAELAAQATEQPDRATVPDPLTVRAGPLHDDNDQV